MVQVLETHKKVLGDNHPDTLTSMGNLALAYTEQGKHKEAENLHRTALEGREGKLGPDHPDTLSSVYCLAHFLATVQQYDESTGLYERASSGFESQLGADHPTTMACRKHFASMLLKWNKRQVLVEGHHETGSSDDAMVEQERGLSLMTLN
jgi:hypothetical protein